MNCDICNSSKTYVKEIIEEIEIKNKTLKLLNKRRFCKNCHHLIPDANLDTEALLKSIALYNEKYGIPKEEIITLRRNYNLNQEEFSKIIGCAKKTLISYEKGTSIPNDNYQIILKTLIKNPIVINTIIEANQSNFQNQEYLKIHNKINKNFS